MSRPTRREMQELAADRDASAARSTRAAQTAREAAANPTLPPSDREQAAAYIPIAERQAQEHREEAEALRDGHLPGEDW